MLVESANNDVQKNIDSGEFHFNKGLEYMETEQYEDAAQSFTKAIQQDSDFVGSYYNLAICCVKVGSYEEAQDLFEKVIEKEPEFVGAYFNAGKAASLQGNYDEAAIYFEHSLNNGIPERQALTAKGIALKGCGRMVEAISEFSKVLNKAEDALCLQYRANSYMAIHEFTNALVDIERLGAIMPATADVLSVKFLCLKQLGKNSAAFDMLEQVKAGDADLYQELVMILAEEIKEISGKENIIQQS